MTGRRRRRGLSGALALGATVILGLAACQEGAAPDDEPTAEPSPASVETAWVDEADVFSDPEDASGTAVVYLRDSSRLVLVGLDAESGDELWRQEASPSGVVPGIAVRPEVTDGHPVYFRRAGGLDAQLVVADAATGEDLVVTDTYRFTSTPETCEDDETAVCVTARPTSGGDAATYRVATDGSGEMVPMEGFEGRPIGAGGLRQVWDDDDRTYFARYDAAGTELWRTPVDEAFGPKYSPDNGWAWNYDEESDTFYGYVGREIRTKGDQQVLRAEDLKTVGLDGGTGDVVWEQPGTRSWCFDAIDDDDDVEDAPAVVRCRLTGSKTFTTGEDPQSDGLTVTVEGFDPATGRTTWEQPADLADGLAGIYSPENGKEPLLWTGETSIVVDQGATALDLTTGRTEPVAETSLWCRDSSRQVTDYLVPYLYDGNANYHRYGGRLESVCDASGTVLEVADAELPTAVPYGFGTDVGDVRVLAMPDGVVALG